ncbi:unnamed protein product [Rotaria sp. Silwood1]|nr:unnamed protein product [Rotaria sp. Silwood1]
MNVYHIETRSANIHPSQLANEVWDYIFFPEKSYPLSSTDISHSTLDHLRNEFQYWYPINLHSSEKDLISNHLIYSLCNHTAIWPNHPEYRPRSFRINGNLLLNSNKISKSTGNFITLLEAIEKFSADDIRLVLANAGDDSIENANFDENKAKELLLCLYTFIDWVGDVLLINPVDIKQKFNLLDPLEKSSDVVSSGMNSHLLQARDAFSGEKLGKKINQDKFVSLIVSFFVFVGPANILPSQLTIEVWDYIFFPEKSYPSSTTDIPRATLDRLRNEFQYWYPVDLRSSGKDLIPNHLTYSIYNHTAIWPNHPELWPRAFRANGHLLLNSEKMSKSTGNFLTLAQAIEKFSADGMRFTLADAGDSIEDANFEVEMAEAQLLRLYTFIEWVKEVLDINLVDIEEENERRKSSEDNTTVISSVINWIKDKLHLSTSSDSANGEFTKQQETNYQTDTKYNYYDHVFESEINRAIQLTEESYEKMLYKDVLKYGFFQLQIARDNYRELCSKSEQMNLHLIKRFIEIQAILLSPICPHICDYVYQFLHPGTTIMNAKWPTAGKKIFHRKKKHQFMIFLT